MIFIDTSALYAVLDRDDRFHRPAKEAWTALLAGDDEEPLTTTNYVLVEAFALVQSRLGVAALRVLADDVLPAIRTTWVTNEDHHAAVQMVLTAARRRLSLVDCSSFHVMRRLGARAAFCFDEHFAEQGFEPLPGRA